MAGSGVRRGLSSQQRKGVWVLALLLVAESVTFSNAVKLWSTYQGWVDDHGRSSDSSRRGFFQRLNEERNNPFAKAQQECISRPGLPLATDTRGNCPAPPSLAATNLLYPRLAKYSASTVRKYAEDCCAECSNCMEPSMAMRECHILRGGHSAAAHAAEAAADAIAKDSGVTPYGVPLHLWKVLFQACLTAINVFCWLVPLRSKKITENKLGLSLANAFSGGVFLSLAFGHLIPECVHGFEEYPESLPYMIVLGGYLLIFFVEKVAFDAHDILHEMEHTSECHHNHHGSNNVDGMKAEPAENGVATESVHNVGRSAVILLGALAVHSILEMMALGLADTFGDCALLTLSIALHQPAESIALLVAFLKSGMPKAQIIQFLSVFSAMGPIGVALGMAVNEFAAPIVDAAMLAVVAGTFVYVGATEVIPEEWEEPEHKWKKFAALMSGIISIFAITQYTMTLGIH